MTLEVRIPSKNIQVVCLGNNKHELIFIKHALICFLEKLNFLFGLLFLIKSYRFCFDKNIFISILYCLLIRVYYVN